jgi:hypothetical protein
MQASGKTGELSGESTIQFLRPAGDLNTANSAWILSVSANN